MHFASSQHPESNSYSPQLRMSGWCTRGVAISEGVVWAPSGVFHVLQVVRIILISTYCVMVHNGSIAVFLPVYIPSARWATSGDFEMVRLKNEVGWGYGITNSLEVYMYVCVCVCMCVCVCVCVFEMTARRNAS